MINTSRWLDIAIFNLKEPVYITGLMIKSGLQQVVRIDKFYYFNMVGKEPYLRISIYNNEDIVKTVFSQKIIF